MSLATIPRPCPICGAAPRATRRSRYCLPCKERLARRRIVESFTRTFWRNTRVTGPDECWEWRGERRHSQRGQEYGAIRFCWNNRRRWFIASRISYRLNRGQIPEGLMVLHTCDFGLCVNPDHLYLGTHADNVRDMVERKRYHDKNTCSRPNCKCRPQISGAM